MPLHIAISLTGQVNPRLILTKQARQIHGQIRDHGRHDRTSSQVKALATSY
jgi:hypothetical protein